MIGSAPAPGPAILLLAMLPIGDTIWTEPTVRALRQRYPEAHITALVHRSSEPIWRCMAGATETVVLPTGPDWRGPTQIVKAVLLVRRRRFHAAVNFTSPAYKWIPWLCGVPLRTYMKFDRLWWILPREHRRWRATHASQHYLDCARELLGGSTFVHDCAPQLRVPRCAARQADEFLRRARLGGRRLVAVHPGGAGLGGLKRWPSSSFARLSDALRSDLAADVLLLGGPEERALADEIARETASPPCSAVGQVSLLTSLALIQRCDLFIGNDSSLLHAAAALGTPLVGIFGPTSTASFWPLARRPGQAKIVVPEPRCPEPVAFVGSDVVWRRPTCRTSCAALRSVSVDRVRRAAADVLHRDAGTRLIAAGALRPDAAGRRSAR